jgi:hypothetical protein
VKLELHTLMGAPGAARAVVDAVVEAIRHSPLPRAEDPAAETRKEPSP